jgi:23S rRNA (adenine2503-C2)-methyltransferase
VDLALSDAGRLAAPAAPKDGQTVLLCAAPEQLEALAVADGQPRFRARQLLDGVMRGARSVEEITNVRPAD